MVTAYIAFGSNLGNRLANLQGGRDALGKTAAIRLRHVSSLYETEPVGGPPGQDNYLNAVAAVETSLAARELLYRCQGIETMFGRQRQAKWGARTLDIDLLFYGNDILQEADLILPHPHLSDRSFVLLPLAEIAPDFRHPVLGRTVRQLLEAVAAAGRVCQLPGEW